MFFFLLKILCIATSAIGKLLEKNQLYQSTHNVLLPDYKTDTVIQTTLRHRLDPGVTVITVAHRLQTIMDADKIVSLSCLYSSTW